MAWPEGLQVLVISGEFAEGVAGDPLSFVRTISAPRQIGTSHCCPSYLLGILENEARYPMSGSRSVGQGCMRYLRDWGGHQIRHSTPDIGPWLVYFCFLFAPFKTQMLSEKAVFFWSYAWSTLVTCLLTSDNLCSSGTQYLQSSCFYTLKREMPSRKLYPSAWKVDLKTWGRYGEKGVTGISSDFAVSVWTRAWGTHLDSRPVLRKRKPLPARMQCCIQM